jgi:hypothetical protein
MALFMSSLSEFRIFITEIYPCLKKGSCVVSEVRESSGNVVILVNVKKEEASEIILASGVSEKGRAMYRMYEERFGRKD